MISYLSLKIIRELINDRKKGIKDIDREKEYANFEKPGSASWHVVNHYHDHSQHYL